MTGANPEVRIEVRSVLQGVRPPDTEAYLEAYFQSEILPLVTPIALDRGHPLPRLGIGSWGLAVRFRGARARRYGVVLVHPALPAIVEAPGGERVALDRVVAAQIMRLFDDAATDACWTFRVLPAASPLERNQPEVARFLADALLRSRRKHEEPLPRAA